MVDSAHAALMAAHQVPPSPEHIGDLLAKTFVEKKTISKKYIDWYEEIRNLAKELAKGKLKEVKGSVIDTYFEKAKEFESVMRGITSKLIQKEKIIRIERKK
jgi:uncharacterized protein (UPF0332 family)